MKIQEALLVGGLAKGNVVAGEKGITRNIASIEVMEVPEVMDWVTSGVLVITTFYSIKSLPDKQIEIVQALIHQKAAGIVIKLGRFITSIPIEIIHLANQHNFPIITIPKDVTYISVLTPLYEKLYLEKQQKTVELQYPLYEFEQSNFSSLPEALNKMAEMVNSPIYIEDLDGRLLYSAALVHGDGWRRSISLFSKPYYTNYVKEISRWENDVLTKKYTEFYKPGLRRKILLPLVWKNSLFAILHISYIDKELFQDVSPNHLNNVANRVSQLFISDQLYLQKNRQDDLDAIEQFLLHLDDINTTKTAIIVNFYGDWLKLTNYPKQQVMDYSSLIRKELYGLANQLTTCETFIFERYNKFYLFLYCKEETYGQIVTHWHEIIEQFNREDNWNFTRVAISPSIKTPTNFEEYVHTVSKTMEVGLKIKPEHTVYTHDKLGIYEILLQLTSDPFARRYTQNVLYPLLQEDDVLVETLQMYLKENGNISKASEKLFIHRRTLNYRIQKIEQLLNMDLNDANHRFILKFCLMIKDLL
ncbi:MULTISPECIES: PucR family transcriptional regulator [Clostridia]|uniref:PucR family transcriptional regulator n=1 Tax=Clostridia TaxID=186801 RepID=UPI000EA0754E|nr:MULTISPECIES: PucR family transcriptional regulator [Clostridia]NBJ68128.1 PucR family transcriptional regulator [Roseburia sp. 1XD42-34]RKI81903.1 PucR family transcriptional regulator [Clostridium sp. 1xD42-85]